MVKKVGVEKITVDDVDFKIGYINHVECSGYVFMMKKNGEYYGALNIREDDKELGWRSGIYATDKEFDAICKARKILRERY